MKLIRCDDVTRYVNPDYIVSVCIDEHYKNGRKTGCFQVVATMTFGRGNEILFVGTFADCNIYIEKLMEA